MPFSTGKNCRKANDVITLFELPSLQNSQGLLTYIMVLYVDDAILTGPIGDFIVGFKNAFNSKFNVQGLYRG
jgi:hypothetical protein